jgi:glutamine synthetase
MPRRSAAITNPTVNSYKRINAPRTISGATWAPNTVTWTGNNRTHMVRVPGPGRFELRLPDGAANPYLLQAIIIAAGLDGIRNNADPGRATTSTCTRTATRLPARRSCRSTCSMRSGIRQG